MDTEGGDQTTLPPGSSIDLVCHLTEKDALRASVHSFASADLRWNQGRLASHKFYLEGAQFSAVSPNPLGGLQPHRFRFCSSVISHFILRAILYIYLEVFMVIEYGTNLFTQLTSTLLPLSLKKAKFCLLHTKSFKG